MLRRAWKRRLAGARRACCNRSVLRARADLEPDIASAAALIGDPSRAAILAALADGRALPAGELARVAGISPQTASSHLDRLFKAHLLGVEVQGRHHYYRLRDARVAAALESLAVIARPARAWTEAVRALRFARTCYGHLAGTLGVAVTEALCAHGFLASADASYVVTPSGRSWFRDHRIAVESLTRRPLAKACLDWSERRHHIAGALGVALTMRALELGWIARVCESRAVRVTDRGRQALSSELGIDPQSLSLSTLRRLP
jgi:DNA-binding transcriptional ArsR family regulator